MSSYTCMVLALALAAAIAAGVIYWVLADRKKTEGFIINIKRPSNKKIAVITDNTGVGLTSTSKTLFENASGREFNMRDWYLDDSKPQYIAIELGYTAYFSNPNQILKGTGLNKYMVLPQSYLQANLIVIPTNAKLPKFQMNLKPKPKK